MELLYSAAGVAAATTALSYRQTLKVKNYTCHEDGSTDCPCITSEKSRPPFTPKLAPLKITLKAGEAAWLCTCGMSKNYPMCDGSHRAFNAANGTSFVPKKVESEKVEGEDLWICSCGHSKNKPFCDGSHRKVKLSKA